MLSNNKGATRVLLAWGSRSRTANNKKLGLGLEICRGEGWTCVGANMGVQVTGDAGGDVGELDLLQHSIRKV